MIIKEIKESIMVLLFDIGEAEKTLEKKSDNQFLRRIYVRNAFSYIEGSIWILKQACLKAKDRTGERIITVGEFNILSEVSYDLKNNGDIKEVIKYLKLTNNFKYTFKIINKLFNANIEINYGEKNWHNLIEAQKIRNRLTHPRRIIDLNINDNEIEICKSTCHWFNDLMHQSFKAILACTDSGNAMNKKIS